MCNAKDRKAQVMKYLIRTFGLAYLVQIGVWLLYQNGYSTVGKLVMSAMMFLPMLGVLLAGGKLSGMGWKPQIKKNVRLILFAWFSPIVLTAIGAGLYFLIFPGHFDLNGAYLIASGGREALEQMEAQGISYPVYVLISVIVCITYAPILNALFAIGEEAGWRGFLYPRLKEKFGQRTGRLIGGAVWGAWHWPLIWLIGYEYGSDYFGFPVVGMLLFCVITVALGILCDWLYEKSGSIWLPAIFHGAFNAAATIPLTVCLTDTGSANLLGPAPVGILAGLPILITAAILFWQKNSQSA